MFTKTSPDEVLIEHYMDLPRLLGFDQGVRPDRQICGLLSTLELQFETIGSASNRRGCSLLQDTYLGQWVVGARLLTDGQIQITIVFSPTENCEQAFLGSMCDHFTKHFSRPVWLVATSRLFVIATDELFIPPINTDDARKLCGFIACVIP